MYVMPRTSVIEPGTVFGRLTVVGVGEPHVLKSGRILATSQCDCDCGSRKTFANKSLRCGNTASCGCINGAKAIPIGTVFGKLTVTGIGPRKAYGVNGYTCSTWECVCECGKVIFVPRTSITSGQKSCGCVPSRLGTAKIIETGSVFGKLTAVGVGERYVRKNGHTEATTTCNCSCGGTIDVKNSQLRRGDVTSCGCQFRDREGDSWTSEYSAWRAMLRRCYNPSELKYPDYGGRGITVCALWRESYNSFLSYVGRKPSPSHSIDRYPNNDGNYEPGNVRWATAREQANNTRVNRLVEFNGQTLSLSEWAYLLGFAHSTLTSRIDQHGWSIKDALTTPPDRRNKRLRNYPRGRKGLNHHGNSI